MRMMAFAATPILAFPLKGEGTLKRLWPFLIEGEGRLRRRSGYITNRGAPRKRCTRAGEGTLKRLWPFLIEGEGRLRRRSGYITNRGAPRKRCTRALERPFGQKFSLSYLSTQERARLFPMG